MAVRSPVGSIPKPGRSMGQSKRESIAGYLFTMPWLIGLLLFTLGPMVASLYFSMTDYSGLDSPRWIGLENYQRMQDDPLFWTSLRNTAYYVVLSVGATTIAALASALLLSADVTGIKVFRTLFYVPVVVPMVANSLLWVVLFNNEGLVNQVLGWFGLPEFTWLFDPDIAMLIYVSMAVWGLGTYAIIFLAGLKDIPTIYYEAASIDGAGALQKFWHITLPLMAPVILFNVVIGVINSFQVFTAAYIITAGGPANSTLFYVLYLYQNAFKYFDLGYASALGWVLFVIVTILTAVQFRVSKSFVYYEADRP